MYKRQILLGATEAGFGGCIIHAVNRTRLREILNLPEQYDIIQVLAFGKPKEVIVLDEANEGEIKYWRDENRIHHVPKRKLEEIILQEIVK